MDEGDTAHNNVVYWKSPAGRCL